MFPFFTIFFLFIIVLNIVLRRQDRSQAENDRRFWERELASNHTRKQDISNLDYIRIPLDKIPGNLHTDAEQELIALSSEKLLNLNGQSNTDLKLQYGVANLDFLSSCDANFARFVAILPVYAEELLAAGQAGDARTLLEFAVECSADSARIFSLLAKLYLDAGESGKIDDLIAIAEGYGSLSGQVIVRTLHGLTEPQPRP